MAAWTSNDLSKIGTAEELMIAPRRPDGTLRNAAPIWVVRVGDDLYVRSWRGRAGAWFRAALMRREGRIQAGGVEKDIRFADVEPEIQDQIDEAYCRKYRRHGGQYVDPMMGPDARATTMRLVPCSKERDGGNERE